MNRAVRLTVNEMLFDRGFNTIVTDTVDRIVASTVNGRRVLVYFVYDPKVSVKKMKNMREMLDDDPTKYNVLILVYKTTITSFAKQFIATDVNDLNVQVFSENELSFNVTKHELVPKHDVLSPEEKATVVSRYKTGTRHFPLMLSTDPVARYYGALPGTMMRITRDSPTAGKYTLYRVVA
jgi:DNA-directed RNA polymerases I, II, and III subunit RPABC1